MSFKEKGADISKHQGDANIQNFVNKGIKNIMIRAGYGKYLKQKDPKFEQNVANCEKLGVDWGAYWYSYATSVAEAKEEAKIFLQVMKGKKPTLPLAYDIEYEPSILALSTRTRTDMVKAFMSVLEDAGYYAILYCSTDFLKNKLYYNELKQYDVWCAQYASACSSPLPYGIWQFSSFNPFGVSGYGSSLDANYFYKDYPSIIKSAGLNGWGKETSSDTPKEENKLRTVTIGPVSNGDYAKLEQMAKEMDVPISYKFV